MWFYQQPRFIRTVKLSLKLKVNIIHHIFFLDPTGGIQERLCSLICNM